MSPAKIILFMMVILVGCAVGAELAARLFAWTLLPANHPVRAHVVKIEESQWTQFDRELGWTNRPEAVAKDVFGEGDVAINSMGLRSLREFESAIPEGHRRVLALGDSFTFGYEIGDGLDWPAQLESLGGAVEAANLGVCGYGLGQAVMRYEQMADQLQHDVVVLGLFAWDVNRSTTARSHHGLAQPKFVVRDGKAVAENLPLGGDEFEPRVAGGPLMLSRLVLDWRQSRERHRFVNEPERSRSWAVGRALLARLRDVARTHDARLIVIEIPDYGQLQHDKPVNEYARGITQELGIEYVSLYAVFGKVKDPLALYVSPHGHCSEAGNRLIAETVLGVMNESK